VHRHPRLPRPGLGDSPLRAVIGGRMRPAPLAAALMMVLVPAAQAARRPRPFFEPTDVELERSGVAELDLSFGYVRGSEAGRVVVPDFELDLGLLPHLELDLDGAYAIEGPSTGPFSFDHVAPDSLWLALKTGFDSVGLQVGPKFPTAPGTHGLGVEALALAAVRVGALGLALNVGGFREPSSDAGTTPRGLEGGLDLQLDLTEAWSLTGELSAVGFFNDDPTQLGFTTGITWSPSDRLDLSIVAAAGLSGHADRYGLLLGVSPKLRLWH
jgi:hypothetical protein